MIHQISETNNKKTKNFNQLSSSIDVAIPDKIIKGARTSKARLKLNKSKIGLASTSCGNRPSMRYQTSSYAK